MSENVSASFEAYISGETVELRTSDFDENEGRADEMGNRQMTNDDLVAGALRSASRHLAGLKRTLRDIPLDNQDMSSAEVAPDMREETAAQAAKRRGESPSISSVGDEVFRVAASIRSMNITPDYLLYGAAQAKRPGLLARLFRRRDIPPTSTVPTAAPMPASGSAISHDALAANAPPQEKISCGEAMPRAERPASDPLPAGGGGSDEPVG